MHSSTRQAAVVATVLLLFFATSLPAADYHVDVSAGVDDLALADGSPTRPWRTLTFALRQLPLADSHVIHLAAGDYSEASGEVLPFRLPANLAVEGAVGGGTVLVDTRAFSAPTIFWQVRSPDVLDGDNALRHLRIDRRTDGRRAGRGIAIIASSTTATPQLENLVVTGAESGIDLLADADSSAALVAPLITNCILEDNSIGLLATAYTYSGQNASADPVITNSVLARNVDGAVFETGAAYGLAPGARRNATSTPVMSHATVAGNIGSGLILDDTNLDTAPAGRVRPSVVNCILSAAAGDYAVNEFSNTSSVNPMETNLFEPSPLGYYLDNGLTPLLTIAEVNALNGASGNLSGTPRFVRDVVSNWHLRPDSPGVDRAAASALAVDIDGEARPTDSDGDGTPRSEIGSDETPHCAVTANLFPNAPDDRCGVSGSIDFDATLSRMTTGFPDCSVPLQFQWHADAEPIPGATAPTFSASPGRTTTYAVRVWCPDEPQCQDTEKAFVTVYDLPTVDAGTGWAACLPQDEDSVAIELLGTASAPEGAAIESWAWTTESPYAAILGGATPAPIVEISGYTDFANLPVDITLTVTDSNGCSASDTTRIDVWRGPRARVDGPYVTCMQPGGQTFLPVAATVETAPGNIPVAYLWATSVGDFDDPTAPMPVLRRNNLPFPVSSSVTVTVTDDKGCSVTSDPVLATFNPSPVANPGGPYQLVEDPGGVTSFLLDGSGSSGGIGALDYLWTSTLGTFVPASADAAMVQLDIVNTGADQTANLCLRVSDENDCPQTTCTIVSIREGALLPPNDVGGTFRIRESEAEALLSWTNAPLDDDHDLAERYEVWESAGELPDTGGWSIRVPDIAPQGGVTTWRETELLDPTGTALLFLKVVARNSSGASCVMPPAPRVTLDPDCAP